MTDPDNRYLELETSKGSWVFNYHPAGYSPFFAVYDEVNDVYKFKLFGDRIETIAIRPLSDNTYDLGSSSVRWRDGWFAGGLAVGDITSRADRLHVKSGPDSGILVESTGDHPAITLKGYDGTNYYSTKIVGGYHGRAVEWHQPEPGRYFMFSAPSATSDNTLQNCWKLWFRCRYWDGSASKNFDIQIIPELLDTSPTGRLRFNFPVPGDILELHSSDGIIAHMDLKPSSDGGANLGSSSYRWDTVFSRNLDIYATDVATPNIRLEGYDPSLVMKKIDDTRDVTFMQQDSAGNILIDIRNGKIRPVYFDALLPYSDNSYDLGSTSFRWKYARLYEGLTLADNSSGLFYNGGQPRLMLYNTDSGAWGHINRWTNRIEIYSDNAIGFAIGSIGSDRMWIADTEVIVHRLFRPSSDSSIDLGSDSYKWRDAYIGRNLHGGRLNLTVNKITSKSLTSDTSGSSYIDPSVSDRAFLLTYVRIYASLTDTANNIVDSKVLELTDINSIIDKVGDGKRVVRVRMEYSVTGIGTVEGSATTKAYAVLEDGTEVELGSVTASGMASVGETIKVSGHSVRIKGYEN